MSMAIIATGGAASSSAATVRPRTAVGRAAPSRTIPTQPPLQASIPTTVMAPAYRPALRPARRSQPRRCGGDPRGGCRSRLVPARWPRRGSIDAVETGCQDGRVHGILVVASTPTASSRVSSAGRLGSATGRSGRRGRTGRSRAGARGSFAVVPGAGCRPALSRPLAPGDGAAPAGGPVPCRRRHRQAAPGRPGAPAAATVLAGRAARGRRVAARLPALVRGRRLPPWRRRHRPHGARAAARGRRPWSATTTSRPTTC